MSLFREKVSLMRRVVLPDADSVHQQISPSSVVKFFVSFINIKNHKIIAYERLVCKAPADYKPTSPGSLPIDVPISVAFSSDDSDPWTETSHKFRFYDQPIPSKCDPCEVEVGAIREIFVTGDENSQFFEPMPSVGRTNVDEEVEERGLLTVANSLGGITC